MTLSIQRANQPTFGPVPEPVQRVTTIQVALDQIKDAATPTIKEKVVAFFKNIVLTLGLGVAILLRRFDNVMPAFLKKTLSFLVDSALAYLIEEEIMPFFFRHYPGAEAETPGPVAADQLFYQQKQYGYFCSIHALCQFAGRKIHNIIGALGKTSNDYWIEQFQNKETSREEALEIAKTLNVYTDSVRSINRNGGFAMAVVREFIRFHKEIFHLPETCTIQGRYGSLDIEEIQTPLQEIEGDPHRHRILVSMDGDDYSHFVAIRKDKASLWRIVDSMAEESEEMGRVQPSFPTLREAIEVALRNHKAERRQFSIIYPSEDNPYIQTT